MLCGTLLGILASTQQFGDISMTAVDKAPSDVIIFWFGHEWYEDFNSALVKELPLRAATGAADPADVARAERNVGADRGSVLTS